MNRYNELMKRLLAVCEAQPEIKAIIIVGSQAREISKADEYSDLDLIIACSDPKILLYENNIINKLVSLYIRLLKIVLQDKKNAAYYSKNHLMLI